MVKSLDMLYQGLQSSPTYDGVGSWSRDVTHVTVTHVTVSHMSHT